MEATNSLVDSSQYSGHPINIQYIQVTLSLIHSLTIQVIQNDEFLDDVEVNLTPFSDGLRDGWCYGNSWEYS